MKMKNEVGYEYLLISIYFFNKAIDPTLWYRFLRQSVHSWSIIDPTANEALEDPFLSVSLLLVPLHLGH